MSDVPKTPVPTWRSPHILFALEVILKMTHRTGSSTRTSTQHRLVIRQHLKMVYQLERGRDDKELGLDKSGKIRHLQRLMTLPLVLQKPRRKAFTAGDYLSMAAILCTLIRPTLVHVVII